MINKRNKQNFKRFCKQIVKKSIDQIPLLLYFLIQFFRKSLQITYQVLIFRLKCEYTCNFTELLMFLQNRSKSYHQKFDYKKIEFKQINDIFCRIKTVFHSLYFQSKGQYCSLNLFSLDIKINYFFHAVNSKFQKISRRNWVFSAS